MSKFLKILSIAVLIILIAYFIFIKILNIPNKVMKTIYPKTFSEYVTKYSEEFDVDPLLVYAVIRVESNFKEDVVSNRNAKGVMQLMDSTADEIAKNVIQDSSFSSEMLFDPEINIKLGTKYLSDLLQRYNGNVYLAIAAYNAGIGNVDRWISEEIIKVDGSDIENIPYKETNNYVRKIIRDYEIYKSLYAL